MVVFEMTFSLSDQDYSLLKATMSRQQAIKEVCAPGQPFELKPTQIRGKTCRVFVNAPLTLHDLFAENRSDLDFLVYGDERHSYSDVYGRASELAAALTNDYGVSHGDRVVIAMRNYPEWIAAYVATGDWQLACSTRAMARSASVV